MLINALLCFDGISKRASACPTLKVFTVYGNISNSNVVPPCLKAVGKKNYFIVQGDVQHLPKPGCCSNKIPVWIDYRLHSVTANLGVFVLTSCYRGLVSAPSESTVFHCLYPREDCFF